MLRYADEFHADACRHTSISLRWFRLLLHFLLRLSSLIFFFFRAAMLTLLVAAFVIFCCLRLITPPLRF